MSGRMTVVTASVGLAVVVAALLMGGDSTGARHVPAPGGAQSGESVSSVLADSRSSSALLQRAPAGAATVVSVTLRDNKIDLSRRRVPVGPVRFEVENTGRTTHNFRIGSRKTRSLAPGERAALSVT
ncbi:MAG: hypothetical protein ACR2OD_13225, partial [Gaiellaceae bacterium]